MTVHEEETDVVLEERRGSVALVTMNRPRYRNAQNARMTYELDAAFNRAVQSDEIKVIVLRAAAPHFSAGHDIGTRGRDIHRSFARVATNWCEHEGKPG